MARYNQIHDGVADLSRKVSILMHVHNYPLIYTGISVQRPKAQPVGSKPSPSTHNSEFKEQKGGLLIRDLW